MNSATDIQLARARDAVQLAEMSRDLIETGLRWTWRPARMLSMIRHPECVVLKASVSGMIAGFAVMEFHDEHCHLNLLAVDESRRRARVAADLLCWLEESARIAGIARVVLEVRSGNQGAIVFYKKNGYQIESRLVDYYQGKESAYRMVHHLIAPEISAERP